MLPAEALQATLPGIQPIAMQGYSFRILPERHRSTAMGADGAKKNGGRFNPPGLPALYTSLERITALVERTELLSDEDPLEPQLFITFDFSATTILDLTNAAVVAAVGSTTAELTAKIADPSVGTAPTQVLGLATSQCGFQGILAPSRPNAGGNNLVLFTENLSPGSYVIYDVPDYRFNAYALVPVGSNVIEFPVGGRHV